MHSIRLELLGNHPALQEVRETVGLVTDTDATVLITGETGTGKELVARALHEQSFRRNKPFIAVNCGALPETLLESELFGHLKGAFTGATATRSGKFEAANGGTIFLDEIGDMTKCLQVKLLRVLQTGEYAPIGSATNRYSSARIVAATNRPLSSLVAAGALRADLFYRLNVISLDLPPLRERPGDILNILRHFIAVFAASCRKPSPPISAECERILLSYSYPGNVRELENIVRRAVILCQGEEILPRHLPHELLESTSGTDQLDLGNFHLARERALEEFERVFLVSLLKESGGIISRAAHRSNLSERNLHLKLRKYGLRGKDFRISKLPLVQVPRRRAESDFKISVS